MADDNIAIQPTTPQTGPVTYIKTFKVKDPNGADVEAQAVVLVDEFGDACERPLTQATGMQILAMLQNIYNVLAESTGVGLRMDSRSTVGNLEQ